MIGKLGLLLLMVCGLSACREDRGGSERAMQYQRMLDASGKRVLVVDAQGNPVAKLRKRTSKFKVYDASLAPVGFVSWQKADTDAVVQVRPLDGEPEPIERVSEDTYALDGAVRIERADRGWAVFDAQAELVGVFEPTDDAWRLRPSYEDEAAFEATLDAGFWTVTRDDTTVLEVRSSELSQLEALALELEGLSMLHRAAVGAWMERGRPDT